MRALPALVLLGGCEYLAEQRDDPDTVVWSGYVYADAPTEDTPVLSGGSLAVVDLDGALLAEGSEPYSGSPGYFEVEVPVDTDVAIRLSGEGAATTLWRARSPGGRAYWLGGALFARDAEVVDDLFDSLSGYQGLDPDPLSDGQVAHLWGQPLDPEALAGASFRLEDGAGVVRPVLALAVDESGGLVDAGEGPVDVFLAADLEPGDARLEVVSPDGQLTELHFPAQGGDLLSPVWFVPGSSP